jgi:hypothetical protein
MDFLFFLQNSRRYGHLAGLISPPSLEVLGICGGKAEKSQEKTHSKP